MNQTELFGVPLLEVKIENYDDHRVAIIQFLESIRESDEGVSKSNHGGWHSSNNLFEYNHPDVIWLIKELYQNSHSCVKTQYGHGEFKLDLKEMWVNINEAGAWNAPHVHSPRIWSGVFYAKVNDKPAKDGLVANEGDLMLFNPLPMGRENNRPVTTSYSPKNGYMILFPSYLLHMVCPHKEDETRISIAFNFDVDM